MKAKMEGPLRQRKGESLAAFERSDPEFSFNWHYHPELELTYIVRSCGVRLVGDHTEEYKSGDLVLLGPNLPHTWTSEGGNAPHQAIVIQFLPGILPPLDLPEMEPIRRLLAGAVRGLRFAGPDTARVALGMRRVLERRGAGALAELLTVLDLLGRAKTRRLLASSQYLPRLGQKQRGRFERVLLFLEQNALKGDTSLEAAARAAHMEPTAFSRFFRRTSGRTYVRFITEMRLAHACRLLIDSDRSVIEIAFDSGFGNLSNFNRHFRTLQGVTPTRYRRLHEPGGMK